MPIVCSLVAIIKVKLSKIVIMLGLNSVILQLPEWQLKKLKKAEWASDIRGGRVRNKSESDVPQPPAIPNSCTTTQYHASRYLSRIIVRAFPWLSWICAEPLIRNNCARFGCESASRCSGCNGWWEPVRKCYELARYFANPISDNLPNFANVSVASLFCFAFGASLPDLLKK